MKRKKEYKSYFWNAILLGLILYLFLPIPLSQMVIRDFVGTETYWYWTTMGKEVFENIYYYMIEGIMIPIFFIITFIPYFIVSKLIIHFYYKIKNKKK